MTFHIGDWRGVGSEKKENSGRWQEMTTEWHFDGWWLVCRQVIAEAMVNLAPMHRIGS